MIKANKELLDSLIEDQQDLTAVQRFAQKHETNELTAEYAFDNDAGRRYQELIPKKTPGPGEQYAFEVNLDQCTGCKACVTACHNENGLDEDEAWRSVGMIQGGTSQAPVSQHITTACHHCADPACMTGCPTKAYEKDPQTGIVRHLEDQCFGCQYCILKCPYDVPKYNKKRGIVHKCDMCISRLNVGEAPACVRACPNEAIRINVVGVKDVIEKPDDYVNIPDTPDSRYTYPTTKYKTARKLPENMVAVDYYSIEPERSHIPLVFMLVLTQLSVGTFLLQWVLKYFIDVNLQNDVLPFQNIVALSVGVLALVASTFHLGRPLYAFRAVLGLKTSWLSREILAFIFFAFFANLYAMCSWHKFNQWLDPLFVIVLLSGVAGVFCSVMVYRDTQRPFWDTHLTTIKFFMTAGILGIATILLTTMSFSVAHPSIELSYVMQNFGHRLCRILGIMMIVKLLIEGSIFFHLGQGDLTFFKKTAILMSRQLRYVTLTRFLCGAIGGALLPFLLLSFKTHGTAISCVSVAAFILTFCLLGELLERYLFFRAVVPLKMPGAN